MKLKRLFALMLAPLLVSSAAAQTNSTPIFQFAIFYNSLLEFVWCPTMTVNGLTYANGDIYVGSICPLIFNSLVVTTGRIVVTNWGGYTTSQYTNTVYFNSGYCTNIAALDLPIGTTNLHEIINLPPAGEDPNSLMGEQRYYDKAEIVLLVTNVSSSVATVTVNLKTNASDPGTNITATYYPTNRISTNYVQVTTNFPFLTLTNTFTDQRESSTVLATDIRMDLLSKWLVTNAVVNGKFPNTAGVYNTSTVPNILYVADNRTTNSGQLTAVRLKNGTIIPTNMVTIAGQNEPSGFTVATPNPLYVWGNYNCPISADLNTWITTNNAYPASLVSDALTILSGNWVDSASNQPLGQSGGGVRIATSTTVNAAIITGVVYSTGSGSNQYSGGVMNLPRLLEDWLNGGSTTLTLNTSFVNLFSSVRATNQWQQPGNYYYAPTRQFSFDQNYLDYTKQPPGTPVLSVLGPIITNPPQNTTVIAGNPATFSVGATGYWPVHFQWQYNGSNAPIAFGSLLVVTNASANNCGVYSVTVTDRFGHSASASATLTVLYPPAITAQPASLGALAGSDITFSVSATGTAPLSYQWEFNDTNLLAGTDATLLVPCVTDDDAGSYSVMVSNAAGIITSTQAVLSVYDTSAAVLALPPSSFTDSFQFTITGVPGLNYAIEASTNLVDWIPLATNTSPCTFVDSDATNFPAQYYRSVYLP